MISMLDGIITYENMKKFVYSNDYTQKNFWKNWHSSFYEFSKRYIYIPSGGNTRTFLSLSLVFGFSSIWHSFDDNLRMWALIIIINFSLEEILRNYFHQKKVFFLKN